MPQATKSPALVAGDVVYYPPDGVGSIVSIEQTEVLGQSLETFVIRFDRFRLTTRVPVNKASTSGLRPLSEFASESELKRALKLISEPRKNTGGMWSRRAAEYEHKIISSSLIDLARVIRDVNRGTDEESEPSYSERMILKKASERLLDILMVIWNLSEEEVRERMQKLLAKAGKRPLSFTF